MITVSIVAALGAMLCWGVGDFFIQKGTRKIGDIETLAWIGVLGSIGLIPFVWKDISLIFQKSNFAILLFLGIITFIIGMINFEALRRGKLSIVESLLEFELPLTVLMGILFLGENLKLIQVILVAVIFSCIIIIAAKPGEWKKHHFFERGALLAITAAAGYGLINFVTAFGAKEISPILIIWFPWMTFSAMCLIYLIAKRRIKSFLNHARTYPSLILTLGILDTLAWVLFAIAVERKELAITIAITESYPAISLLLGISVNHEKISRVQIVAATIAIAASFLMGILG